MAIVSPDYITRQLKLLSWLKRKSILLLLGPRQTGKSTLLRHAFPEARYIDLLESDTFREFSAHPELLRQRLSESDRILIVDEIQKLPELLDEVQAVVDRNKDLRVILNGLQRQEIEAGQSQSTGWATVAV